MIDFDHFKEINDSLGHAEGDRLLVEGARRMTECLRTEDSVGRYGGEEFLGRLPDDRIPKGPFAVGERLRRAVSSVQLSARPAGMPPRRAGDGQRRRRLLATRTEGLDDLLRRADAALYEAKQAGRDRVVFR